MTHVTIWRMRWTGRLVRIFALGWLVLVWPEPAALIHLPLARWREAALAAALAVFVALYVYFCLRGYRRREPWLVAAQVVVLTILAAAFNQLSGLTTVNGFIIPQMVAGFGFRRPLALATIVVIGVLALGISLPGAGLTPGETVAYVTVLAPQLLLWGGGAMGLRYLLDVLAELRAAREQIARLAVDEERARISRDLHDLLGQSLSLVTLKGELASRLVPADSPGGTEVRDIVRLARGALGEVRDAVSGYRQPTLATELSAARTALAAAGISCDVEQSLGALSRETEAVLGWAVREGVTNVIRHSRAAHCRIALLRADGVVRAEVVDDGVGAGGAPAGSGLRGLGERADAIGGRLETGRGPGRGFRLTVAAPP
jgi:two-component system, NarL family, sensor histidine kinase DesK